ncbi:HMCN1 [Branchiostoma lanceolatum]|uniref:HMCN1 protein n=1 Tax=Branchiostoma lanceolatum TaxID=7740 RepID=A0A8K0A583_BRALA|nr:HMCN1 [Branchiostoma lanceolatum]
MVRTAELPLPYRGQKLWTPKVFCDAPLVSITMTSPGMTIDGTTVQVIEGKSVTIRCNVESNPPSTIRWEGTRGVLLPGSEPELHISATTRNQNGTFICTVTNSIASTANRTTVEVLYPPKILTKVQHRRVTVGAKLILECVAEGNPAPTIIWLNSSNSAHLANPLVIPVVSYSMTGKYICIAASSRFSDRLVEKEVLIKVTDWKHSCMWWLRGQIYTQTKYPALKAAVETVCEDSAEPQQLLRSLECSQLVSVAPGAKVVRCTKCDSLRSAVKQARWRREKLKRVTGNVSQIPAKKTRWDFLSEEEKKNRYNAEQAKRVRADDRAEYHKDRYATLKETIRLAKEDHEDIEHMFNKMDSDVTKLFPKEHRKQLLWKIQRDHVLNKRNQWNPEFLDVCLQLWQRSKQGYADLKDSGFLKLPSERLLQYKKNTVNQRPGLHTEVFEWMNKEAEQQRVTERGRHGFIVFDEMKIQVNKRLRWQLMFSRLHSRDVRAFFPFVWYPTTEIAPICIFNCHWDSVFYLEEYGFFSHACLCDGGQANRDFIKGHFGSEENAIAKKFTINNLYGEGSYSFIMDPPNYQEFKRHQKGDDDSMSLTREYISAGNETMDDPRLMRLDAALHWFLDWKQDVMDSVNLTSKERNKSYISEKLHFDLCSMVFGFKSYIHTMTSQFPGMGLVAGHTNQDALENMFGCIRASNGSNTNPTVLQYGPSVNGYIHCRSFKVRNGNSARKN